MSEVMVVPCTANTLVGEGRCATAGFVALLDLSPSGRQHVSW